MGADVWSWICSRAFRRLAARIETEKVLDVLPANVAVETPHALDVKRENGLIALRGGEELALSVDQRPDLQRVDAEEFGRTTADPPGNLASVFLFSNRRNLRLQRPRGSHPTGNRGRRAE